MDTTNIKDCIYDFNLYKQKVKQEPVPKLNSKVWSDDPFCHDEEWHNKRKEIQLKRNKRNKRKKHNGKSRK